MHLVSSLENLNTHQGMSIGDHKLSFSNVGSFDESPKIQNVVKASWEEFLLDVKNKIARCSAGLKIKPAKQGTSGVYIIKTPVGKAVYKPISEASASKNGIPKDQEAFRERLGYLISEFLTNQMKNNNFSLGIKNFGVPKTTIALLPKNANFDEGLGSFQKFKKGVPIEDCSEEVLVRIQEAEFLKLFFIDILSRP